MNELHATPAAAPSHVVAVNNGQASLSDRVRSLRLADHIAAGGGGGGGKSWLPWVLCALLAASTLYLASTVSSVPPSPEHKSEPGAKVAVRGKAGPKSAAGSVIFENERHAVRGEIAVDPQRVGLGRSQCLIG